MAIQATAPAEQQAAVENNISLVLDYWENVWNQGQVERLGEYYIPELIEGRRYFIVQARAAFPDSHVTIDDVIATGDKVVVRYSWTGTHQHVWDFALEGIPMNAPPTGKALWDRGIAIFRVADGKIVEMWSEWTKLELAQQLGLAPGEQ
jgi:predicted ester cyclase